MANLIIQDNNVERTLPAVHGEEITIKTPCNCSDVTGVQIAGVVYPFYDAAGNPMEMGTGLFSKDNLIRVLIDVENTRATIINHAITPDTILAAWRDHTHDGSHIVSGLADLATRMGVAKLAYGQYVGTSTYASGSSITYSTITIPTGFKTRLLIFFNMYGTSGNNNDQTQASIYQVYGYPRTSFYGAKSKTQTVTWGNDSVTITNWASDMNQKTETYLWFALGE